MSGRVPLRVCHVSYSFYESDNRVIRYAETLASRGDKVDVISLKRFGEPARSCLNGVNVHRIQRRAVNERTPLTYLFKILWFFFKCFVLLSVRGLGKAYDVVHVHNIPDFLVFAALLPRLRGAAVILDIHDLVPELYAGKFGVKEGSRLTRTLLLIEQVSCRFAAHVIVANHLWHDKIVGRSVPGDRCTAILNYPDLALFRPLARERLTSDGRFVFLYPGSLNHHQGLDIAIRAFAEASREMPKAELHIYGDGPDSTALQRLAEQLALGDQVKLKDRVPLSAVPRLMSTSDAGVVPKRADGFGNEAFSTKVLEFMACGVPVVVSRTRVDSHYFTERLVYFFEPGNVEELAATLVRVYHQEGDLPAKTARARHFARQNSWQEHSHTYTALLEGLRPRGESRRRAQVDSREAAFRPLGKTSAHEVPDKNPVGRSSHPQQDGFSR